MAINLNESSSLLFSWLVSYARVNAIKKGSTIEFQSSNEDVVNAVALKNIRGWTPPEDIEGFTDLKAFYKKTKLFQLNESEIIFSLVDRDMIVGSTEQRIRLIVFLENKNFSLLLKYSKESYLIPLENIKGIGQSFFSSILGKVNPNIYQSLSDIFTKGITHLDLENRTIEFDVTPIYVEYTTNYPAKTIVPLNVDLSINLDSSIAIEKIRQAIAEQVFPKIGVDTYQYYENNTPPKGNNTPYKINLRHDIFIGYGSFIELEKENLQICLIVGPSSLSYQGSVTYRFGDECGDWTSKKFKEKVYDHTGIPPKYQTLTCHGRFFANDDDKVLGDYYWKPGDEIRFSMGLRGGGPIKTSFVDLSLENERKIDFAKTAPRWRIIHPGLNLKGICTNEECEAFSNEVWIPQKFGSFNLLEIRKNSFCPCCQNFVLEVTNCGFYQCIFSLNGKTKSNQKDGGKLFSRSNQIAPNDCLLSFNDTGVTGHMLDYQSLIIETKEIAKTESTLRTVRKVITKKTMKNEKIEDDSCLIL